MRSLLAALALLVAAASPALARSIEIDDFRAVIDVREDGTVEVEERIAFRFEGSWNGIIRVIPYGYTSDLGVRGSVRLTLDAVQDEAGKDLEHWTTRSKGRIEVKVRVPGASDATRTVVLRYRCENLIRSEEYDEKDWGAVDELYWNVTGNDWDMPIARASAEVRLPKGVPADQVRAAAYVGPYGSKDPDARVTVGEGNVLAFRSDMSLPVRSGLTIVVVWPPGFVEHPGLVRRGLWFLEANWAMALPIAALLLVFLVWWRRGRDSLGERTVIPEFEAPEGLRPYAGGVLTDDRLDSRDLTATILDLAVRGVLTIQESGSEKDPSFRLTLHPERRHAAALDEFEQQVVESLFGTKQEVALTDLRYKFFSKLPALYRTAYGDLVERGLFRGRPDRVRAGWTAGVLALVVGLGVLGLVLRVSTPYWLAWALSIPFLFVLARRMPQRTPKGLDLLARLRGIEDYLVTAEKERMESLPMPQVERLLPFAVALGLQDRWSEAFGHLFQQPPDWYRTTRPWSPVGFGSTLGRFHGGVGSTLYSFPRATTSGSRSSYGGRSWGGGWSGGGGFSSGGGFSGGGFGGGGGRGW